MFVYIECPYVAWANEGDGGTERKAQVVAMEEEDEEDGEEEEEEVDPSHG